jgi:4-hydroxy-tetrahydrodipicolinate synthase
MTSQGLDAVIAIARRVQSRNPELLAPLADYFEIDIEERLEYPEYRKGLEYDAY